MNKAVKEENKLDVVGSLVQSGEWRQNLPGNKLASHLLPGAPGRCENCISNFALSDHNANQTTI